MKKRLSQEWLKAIACITMLIDHIGAVFVPGYALRLVGRLSFPIYCFLLAEGVQHTRNRKRYGLRLLIGALLSEIPFDLLFFGRITWRHQSVMVTLLLSFWMLCRMEKWGKYLAVAVAAIAAELLGADYGALGVILVAVFALAGESSGALPMQAVGMGVCFLLMDSMRMPFLGLRIPIQLFGLLALIPLYFYSGEKATKSRMLQWGFYLFYPVHLIVLLLYRRL